MKTLTVAFIGHRKLDKISVIAKLLRELLSRLIEEENAETFLFGGIGSFDALSHDVVTDMKKKNYPQLRRVYVRAKDEFINLLYENFILNYFDETVFPEGVRGAGYRAYVKRNQIMIDMCDVLVTYYDKEYQLLSGKNSGTKVAVEYATKKNKRIINLHESGN